MSQPTPVAFIDGSWIAATGETTWPHHNPAQTAQILNNVPLAGPHTTRHATSSTARLQNNWGQQPVAFRLARLAAWKTNLQSRQDEILALMILEVGKPRSDAAEEFHRTLSHLDSIIRIVHEQLHPSDAHDQPFRTLRRPVGTVLVITPWNNPLAIPVSKIAAALAFGNGVVWKPALQTSRLSILATDCLLQDNPSDLPLSVVFGDKQTAAHLLDAPGLHAVTFTGSCQAGLHIATHCGRTARPFQAEMGGNNPVLILPGANLEAIIPPLLAACFSFSGQRCTAMRRLIVHESLLAEFTAAFTTAASRLTIGPPDLPDTIIGPLISTDHRDRILHLLQQETHRGSSRILTGGRIPPGHQSGAWLEPTVIEALQPDSPLVTEELFAPVVTIQSCRDSDEAFALANRVAHGLMATLFSPHAADQERFLQEVEAGMLRVNPASFAISPDAPFIGWKCSALGPPEHGSSDADFYSKIQVVYR
ncbi:MAG: aldehyde dehydrogenase family protein [Verrucomicrobia bacterium]|nr:aldehyde dehydrogenase family protein [Verrucomicrobiota bacterium]